MAEHRLVAPVGVSMSISEILTVTGGRFRMAVTSGWFASMIAARLSVSGQQHTQTTSLHLFGALVGSFGLLDGYNT